MELEKLSHADLLKVAKQMQSMLDRLYSPYIDEMESDEHIQGSDAVDSLCEIWGDDLKAILGFEVEPKLLPIGTKVLHAGERDEIVEHVDPTDNDNFDAGYRYFLKFAGAVAPNAITEDFDEYENWK